MLIERDYGGTKVFFRIVNKEGNPQFQVLVNADIQKYRIKKVIEGKAIDGFGFGVDLEDILDTIQLFLDSTHSFVKTPSGIFSSETIRDVFSEFRKSLRGEESKVKIVDNKIIYDGNELMEKRDFFYSIQQIILQQQRQYKNKK